MKTKRLLSIPILVLFLAASPASAEDQAAELAKQLNNPVASLISVPFQSNWDFGLGDGSGQRFTMNLQPVVPISISKDWNLINRMIMPVIDQNGIFPGAGGRAGMGCAANIHAAFPDRETREPADTGRLQGAREIVPLSQTAGTFSKGQYADERARS